MYVIMKQKSITKNGYSFRAAYDSLGRDKQRYVLSEICKVLEINRFSFYHRMKGVIPSHPDYLSIKEIFKSCGIDKVFDYERSTIKQPRKRSS